MLDRICIIILLNIVFFWKAITYKYCSDDIPASQRKKEGHWFVQRVRQLTGHYRFTPQEDHFLTTIIHTINAVFVYLAFGASDVSFLASILFSINPINNQGSVWISGRAYALAIMGILGAIAFPILALPFITLSCLTNAGYFAPIVLLGSPYPFIFAFAPAAWFFYRKRFFTSVQSKMTTEMFGEDKKVHIGRLVIAIKTVGYYLIDSIIPFKISFYHAFLQSAAGNDIMKKRAYALDRFFWIGLISITSIITYWTLVPWNYASFGLLWFCVFIAPFTNLIRMSQECAERYCYAPLPGLMFVLASVLMSYPYITPFVIGVYMTRLWIWMDAYQDDYFLSENSRLASTDSWFAQHVSAMLRWNAKSYKEAVILWLMALQISPKEFKILLNLSSAFKMCGHQKEAKEYYDKAMANIPLGQEDSAKDIDNNVKQGKLPIVL